ncbi:MAG: RdgB/HAM1 family non-canonical purine NTP pyrophosphatase [Chloroflexia bacterium]
MRLVLASANPHKLDELAALLRDMPLTVEAAAAAGMHDFPEETGGSFAENALLKARACAAHTGRLSLGDDSGLMVDALDGFPGVHSNRWAGPGKTDAELNELLLEKLRDVPPERRRARFVCAVAIVAPDGEGVVIGRYFAGVVADRPRGAGGFGYDPIMYLPERGLTVAELSPDEKNRISHRAQAMTAAKEWLRDYLRL